MSVYLALLRAIGPVTHAKMSMAALRERCEAAGFAGATTVGNTGNLLVRSDGTAAQVRTRIREVVDGFAINSEVFLRSAGQLRHLVRSNPFPTATADHPSRVGICFFHRPPRWPADYDGPETIAIITSHLVIDYGPEPTAGMLPVEKLSGMRMTQRNWSVVARLAEKAAQFGR